ncbi:MAG TPA: PRC-barrel domain-containing protein [Balneolaceae bacterium]|nr:PRC-barrel domain-containing protein [Balneolaceae bacterium]
MKAKRFTPMKPIVKLATEIMGTKVKTPEGEDIGVVQNLMIDPQRGTIIFMVLCYANFIGKMHRLFAIPNRMLTVKYSNEASLFLEIEKDKLLGAHAKSSDEDEGKKIYEIMPEESKHAKAEKILHVLH